MTDVEIDLLRQLVAMANERSDGHLTIMKFTTNWRVTFETPEWHEDVDEWRACIDDMPVGQTFEEAARRALDAVRP